MAVDQAIIQYYRSMQRMEEDIQKILEAGLQNLVTTHLSRACTGVFSDTKEHAMWEQKVYTLRNAVVHDGQDIDEEAAALALEAAEAAINWIDLYTPLAAPIT